MPSTYTTRLRLTLPATGELNNTWGNTVNSGITELLDAAIAGTATISTWGGAGVAYTLSNNNGVADEARCMFIVASGAPGEAKNIICPNVSKLYVVTNSVSGGFSVTLKTAAGTGISVENGKTAILRCDGTNVVNAITQLPSFVVAGGTPNQVQFLNASRELTGSANMTFDGTTLSVAALADASLTSGRVTYATTGGNLTDSANLTFDGTALTLGGNPTLTAGTANGVLYLNGSKVATSGSALVFNGSDLTIGGTAVNGKLNLLQSLSGASNAAGIWLSDNATTSMYLNNTSSGVSSIWTSGALAFGVANGTFAEAMRLNSTGLGIGTSSPGQRLAVRSADNSGATNIARFESNNAAQGVVVRFASVLGDGGTTSFGTLTNNVVQIAVNNSEVARFDTSGNLGIGTSSPQARLQAAYTAPAAVPAAGAGGHGVAVGSSGFGLAGGALSSGNAYLQATRWDGSATNYDLILQPNGGNVGIGKTPSSDYRLDVNGSIQAISSAANTTAVNLVAIAGHPSNLRFLRAGYAEWFVGSRNNDTSFNITTTDGTHATPNLTISAAGNLGIGTATPVGRLDSRGAAYLGTNSNNAFYVDSTASVVSIGAAGRTAFSTSALAFITSDGASATERMRLDASGNLGIGTTSPVNYGAGYTTLAINNTAAGVLDLLSSGVSQFRLFGTGAENRLQGITNVPMTFWTNNQERARITSGGQLVLNSGATGNQLQFWDTGAVAERARLGINASNGLDFAVGSTAPRMTITSGGDLLVGTTSDGAAGLGISNLRNLTFPEGSGTSYANLFRQAGSGATILANGYKCSANSNALASSVGTSWAKSAIGLGAGSGGTIIFYTDAATTVANGTDVTPTPRATITSGGELCVATTSATNTAAGRGNITIGGSSSSILNFSIGGADSGYLFHDGTNLTLGLRSSGYQAFTTNNQERARITSGGDLLVGDTTGNDGRVRVDGTGNANNCAFWGKTSGGATASTAVWWNNTTTGDNLFERFYTEGTATLRGSIDYNRAGGLVRYNTTSDYRAKDIIGPVQNPGATIDALKVYEGKMKGATQTRPMLVAHEAQEVAPYAVSGTKDEVNPDGTPKFQQIDVSSLVPLLLAELQSLRARVAQLERH